MMIREIGNIGDIETACDLDEAREIIKKDQTDVVVLDIQLPDGNGLDFLKWIKRISPVTRVIMFSNFADESHREAARNDGADYFFDKSHEFEEVPRALSLITVRR